jgi:hypothetical protein
MISSGQCGQWRNLIMPYPLIAHANCASSVARSEQRLIAGCRRWGRSAADRSPSWLALLTLGRWSCKRERLSLALG